MLNTTSQAFTRLGERPPQSRLGVCSRSGERADVVGRYGRFACKKPVAGRTVDPQGRIEVVVANANLPFDTDLRSGRSSNPRPDHALG